MLLEGVFIRGPVQSRPAWERELEEADAASRAAWRAYADAVFRFGVPGVGSGVL